MRKLNANDVKLIIKYFEKGLADNPLVKQRYFISDYPSGYAEFDSISMIIMGSGKYLQFKYNDTTSKLVERVIKQLIYEIDADILDKLFEEYYITHAVYYNMPFYATRNNLLDLLCVMNNYYKWDFKLQLQVLNELLFLIQGYV